MADVSLSSTSSNLLSGSIKWTGLASGTDFGSVVDQLLKIEKVQMNRLELWKSEWSAKIESIKGLNERMASLEEASRDMDTFTEFYSRSSTSSNTSVLTTTNVSTATPGSHSVVVAEDIPGISGSLSFDGTSGIGGDDSTDFIINIGNSALTLIGGVDFNSASTIFDLASAINAKDDAGTDMLTAEVKLDKDRDGTSFYRLFINSKRGGSESAVTVSDPTKLNFDDNSIDSVFEKTWLGSSHATSSGTYLGSTNKTFTFTPNATGEVGTDEIEIRWADTEGNSGKFTVSAAATEYEVAQGVKVSFSAGQLIKNDSFTIDVYNPTVQAAQDQGLARAEQRVHEGFIDLLSPITTVNAKFVYRYAGTERQLDVTADSKLQDLVDAINTDPNNPGVRASIINDGMNTTTSYHLVLTGEDTGAAHTIVIDSAATTLNKLDADDNKFSTAQKASNAMLQVDGYPTESGVYLQRSSNTVSDIVDGVILSLQNVGSSTVTVNNNTSQVKKNVELFVNSVNFVLDYINSETKYDAETKESGTMLGNYSYDIVASSINNILFNKIDGLDSETDTYVHLGQIGINTDPDAGGRWTIDSTKLEEALNNDLEGVARLFVKDSDRGTTGVASQMMTRMEEFTDSETGIGNVLIDNYKGIISNIDNKIDSEERRIQLVKERMEAKFARLEKALSTLNGQSSSLESLIARLPKNSSS